MFPIQPIYFEHRFNNNFENLFFRFQSHPGDDPSVNRASHATLLRVTRHVRNVDPCDAVINFLTFYY
jgi:hypothetical protein